MRNKRAKFFRRLAEELTVGKSDQETSKHYQRLKKVYKITKHEK
jgi:hypothetical protein